MNPRQQRFVDEYLIDLNGYRAARRAGYEEKWARHIASRLLRKPEIAAAVEKAKEERRERLRITADRVLAELARLAFADIGRLLVQDGKGLSLKDTRELSPERSRRGRRHRGERRRQGARPPPQQAARARRHRAAFGALRQSRRGKARDDQHARREPPPRARDLAAEAGTARGRRTIGKQRAAWRRGVSGARRTNLTLDTRAVGRSGWHADMQSPREFRL